ncbi:MAG: hypothetical protein QMD71_04205 [bacterium]|nr:hypothetical protein [bacterium]
MIRTILESLSTSIQATPIIALGGAFIWGIISILMSPCHLASIPLIVGFIDGQGRISTKRAFLIATLFALGILITIAIIGLITGLIVYGVGHCSVIVFAGSFTEITQHYLNWSEVSKGAIIVKRICGVLVILGGIYLIWSA